MYKQILVFISLILLLSACRKRTQEIETEFNFIKHKYHYNLVFDDTTIYENYGLLYYEEDPVYADPKEDYIYRTAVFDQQYYPTNLNKVYDLTFIKSLKITGGGIFGGGCSGWLAHSDIIVLPFQIDHIKNPIKIDNCGTLITLELISKSTILNIPSIGDVVTKAIFRGFKGSDIGTVYYYNEDYLLIKVIEQYDKKTKKGTHSFTLNRVE